MKHVLQTLLDRRDLDRSAMEAAFDKIMSAGLSAVQLAAFITALRMKGESAEELAGAAASMRRHAKLIDTNGLALVDTCGTGGDQAHTFNISTAAALVVAGAGVPVAKHGNRAVTSRCGSADVLAELGLNVTAPPEVVEACIREVGIGFLYAPQLHPAMQHASGVRRELGIRTIFNILGPLTNPAGAKGQILGVYEPALTELFAQVLCALGSRRAFIVHGHDGLDEITVTTSTRVSELRAGAVHTYEFDPLPLIGEYYSLNELAGGDPPYNAAIIRRVLAGEAGACREAVLLNAAAGIMAGAKADSWEQAMAQARQSIDSGRAATALSQLIEYCR